MGSSKSSLFSEQENRMAGLTKALAHPARIAIVNHLLKEPGCICGDIVLKLPLAQPTISRHLKELKNAGIIRGNVEGNAICYCLNAAVLEEILQYFSRIKEQLTRQQNSCC
jgi:DNA-binding transcriptional ArsR family regulator